MKYMGIIMHMDIFAHLVSTVDFLAGPPPNIQKLVASKRLQQAQAQVGEVVDIMRVNVEKVLERDQKISELDRRADDLQEGASQFQQHAVKLKRKYWWENIKMWIVIGIILLTVVIIVVVTTTTKVRTTLMTSSSIGEPNVRFGRTLRQEFGRTEQFGSASYLLANCSVRFGRFFQTFT